METSTLVGTLLPLSLGLIMFGLGLTLEKEDFTRILRFPKPIYIGLAAQILLLPLAAYFLCRAFSLPAELAIGLMLLSASPGGITANIFSHLAGGDVALNLTLTAINSVLAAVTLPVILGIAIRAFASAEQEIGLQFSKALEVFAIVLIPVGIGMFVRHRFPAFSGKLDRPFRIFSVIILIALVAGAIGQNRAVFGEYFAQLGLVVLIFNLVSLGVGYGLPRALRLSDRQSIAIALEIGVHNSTLAMALAVSVLGSLTYAMPAAFYSVIMFITAALFTALMKRTAKVAATQS